MEGVGGGREADVAAAPGAAAVVEAAAPAPAEELGIAGAGDLTRRYGNVGGAVAAAPGVKNKALLSAPSVVVEDVEAEEFRFGGRVDGRAGGGSAAPAREEEEAVEEVGESGRLAAAVVDRAEVEGRRGSVEEAEERGLVSSLGVTSPLLSSTSSSLS